MRCGFIVHGMRIPKSRSRIRGPPLTGLPIPTPESSWKNRLLAVRSWDYSESRLKRPRSGDTAERFFGRGIEVLDLFLKLIDRIITLLRGRAQRSVHVFQDLIEPLFNDMPLVVQYYLGLFRQAEELLMKDGEQGRDLVKSTLLIAERREELIAIRRKIQQLTHLVETTFDDERVCSFARAVAICFYSFPTEGDREGLATDATTLVGLFERLATSELTVVELYDLICQARHTLEQSWTDVTRRYAELRLEYVHNQRNAV
jgi:hypothetical protein